jgi:hypothetical protein
MACGYCGSRLISKGSQGLECCGCGRPLAQTRLVPLQGLSLGQQFLAMVVCLGALPLVGAIAATGELRAGGTTPSQERSLEQPQQQGGSTASAE